MLKQSVLVLKLTLILVLQMSPLSLKYTNTKALCLYILTLDVVIFLRL